MKKILFLLFVIALSLSSFAQDKAKKTPEQKARAKTTEMVAIFKLSKEQDAMLYTTHLKYYQTTDAYEAGKHSKKEEKKFKDQSQALREKDYKRILTPAQYKQHLVLEKAEDADKAKEKKAKKAEKEKKAKTAPASKKK